MTRRARDEGLRTARLLMVLGSVSPLFILWAIRGSGLISDYYLLPVCALMVIVPNGFLWLRISVAKKLKEKRQITVGKAEDHRDHLLVYLLAMLLPFYADTLANWRALTAALAALGFVIFLFWQLNLHYMNFVLAIFGYRVFTIYPPADENPLSGRTNQILITRRALMSPGDTVTAYRISDTVYFEVEEWT